MAIDIMLLMLLLDANMVIWTNTMMPASVTITIDLVIAAMQMTMATTRVNTNCIFEMSKLIPFCLLLWQRGSILK